MNKKAQQIGIETMFALSALIALFIFILFISNQQKEDIETKEDFIKKIAVCSDISSAISSVFGNEGSSILLNSNFIINFPNKGVIEIGGVENKEEQENDIAFLISDCGPTEESAFDPIDSSLQPDWYATCVCGGSSQCPSWYAQKNITEDFDDLINNINDYETIYLEDSTFDYRNYNTTIEEWVKLGKILVLSEHPICRYDATFPSLHECDYIEGASDEWDFVGVKFYQKGGSYSNNVNITNVEEPFNFELGEILDLEERTYIKDISSQGLIESESLTLAGGFSSSSSCICSSPSNGNCIRHTGSTSNWANATWTSDKTGTYNVTIRYCGENDGNDDWRVYHNDLQVDSWTTTNQQPSWSDRTIQVNINQGDTIKLSCDRGTSSSYCRTDYIEVTDSTQESIITEIGKYVSGSSLGETAIGYWDHGSGRVYYFGDFQVNMITNPQKDFRDILTNLIKEAYFYLSVDEITCSYVPDAIPLSSDKDIVGDFLISNTNGEVTIKKA